MKPTQPRRCRGRYAPASTLFQKSGNWRGLSGAGRAVNQHGHRVAAGCPARLPGPAARRGCPARRLSLAGGMAYEELSRTVVVRLRGARLPSRCGAWHPQRMTVPTRKWMVINQHATRVGQTAAGSWRNASCASTRAALEVGVDDRIVVGVVAGVAHRRSPAPAAALCGGSARCNARRRRYGSRWRAFRCGPFPPARPVGAGDARCGRGGQGGQRPVGVRASPLNWVGGGAGRHGGRAV